MLGVPNAEWRLEEHATRVEEQRRELPWVPVENEYTFATEGGPRSLSELFEGRSQLLIYHLMFGEDWEVACPGCTSVPDGLGGVVAQMNEQDVTLLCMSRAPLEKPVAFKEPRGWTVPWVSGHGNDFLFDYGFAFRREEMSSAVRDGVDLGEMLREAPAVAARLSRGGGGARPRVRGLRERGLERVCDAPRRGLQHLPRLSAITPHNAGAAELLPNED